ncbi:hypothetical protein KLVA111870_26310 [Klebsiella variicola]
MRNDFIPVINYIIVIRCDIIVYKKCRIYAISYIIHLKIIRNKELLADIFSKYQFIAIFECKHCNAFEVTIFEWSDAVPYQINWFFCKQRTKYVFKLCRAI